VLTKEAFVKEVDRLEIEFADKGFTMSKEKAEQWYDLLKDLTEHQLHEAVNSILRNSKFSPVMSDVYTTALTFSKEPHKPVTIIIKKRDGSYDEYPTRA
jgi:hypothetical protein